MAIPILDNWHGYFDQDKNEGLGSSYERIILNRKLIEIKQMYGIQNCLEVPAFGFTGVSGINSMKLALMGTEVSLIDHDEHRLQLIKEVWNQINIAVNLYYSKDYCALPFDNKSFDFSWNFSALWFVSDLFQFLKEITRLTRKAILFCVPNRLGMGYITQKYFSGRKLRKFINEKNIISSNFIKKMETLGWNLVDRNYIDVPPWPDTGVKKEKILKKLGIKNQDKGKRDLCVLNFYSGKEPYFQKEMMKYYWFEKHSPRLIKRFWAHHRYFLFEPHGVA